MRRGSVPMSMLFPLFLVGACQPAGDPAVAESQAAVSNLPPGGGGGDPPPLDGPISPLPRNLHVTKNFGGVVIQLDFDCGGNAELHELFHQVDGAAWSKIGEGCVEDGPERGHIFDNFGIQPLHNYCYKVKASNVDHDATSEVVCATADRWRMAPVLPKLTLSEIRPDSITLLIVDKSVTEQGFHLLRRVKGGSAPFVSVAEFDARVGINVPFAYRDSSITLGKTYEYKVNVFDRFGNNADTPILEAAAFPELPDAPSLIMIDTRTPSSMRAHWTNSGDVVDTYHLSVAGPSGNPQSIDVSGSTLDRTLSSLVPSSEYCVTITAENRTGISGPTHACAWTLAPPPSIWLPPTTFDLQVDPPVVTLISAGDAHSTAWYRFSFRVCNNGANRPPAPLYHISADLFDGLETMELTLDHASQHPLDGGDCDTFVASTGVWSGLHSVRASVQATSGTDAYSSNDLNNLVFRVP